MLAHCSPSRKWVPGDSTGEIKVANQGGGALSSISLTTERAPPLSNSLHTNYHFSVSYLYIVCNLVLKVCISCFYCTSCISI